MTHRHPKKTYSPRPEEGGVGLVEAVVVISIMSVAFAALLNAAVMFVRGGLFASDKVQVTHLLEEGVEVVRFLRDESYTTNITPLIGAGTRYLATTTTAVGWGATTTNTPLLGNYTRSITLSPVYRRVSNDDIVPSTSGDPKTIDPGTAQLSVTVAWGTYSETLTTYVADIYGN